MGLALELGSKTNSVLRVDMAFQSDVSRAITLHVLRLQSTDVEFQRYVSILASVDYEIRSSATVAENRRID